ncbi:hypothetical protein F5880DRAFT_1509600 [Lentinula raphanica]|nr:hypothetical protein F5880DRAFT_1509600 [Lentinula raphanica]
MLLLCLLLHVLQLLLYLLRLLLLYLLWLFLLYLLQLFFLSLLRLLHLYFLLLLLACGPLYMHLQLKLMHICMTAQSQLLLQFQVDALCLVLCLAQMQLRRGREEEVSSDRLMKKTKGVRDIPGWGHPKGGTAQGHPRGGTSQVGDIPGARDIPGWDIPVLTALGLTLGDAIRLKREAPIWWNGPLAKCKLDIADNTFPGLSKKPCVQFEKHWKDSSDAACYMGTLGETNGFNNNNDDCD